MKIAFDCYEVTDQATGAGRVIDNILKHLIEILPEEKFFLFTREKIERFSKPNVNQHIIPGSRGYFRWQNGPFMRGLKEVEPDVLIASNYTLPLFCKWNSVLFVHDISIIVHPEWYPKKVALGRGYLLKRSLKKANAAVVPSEFTKEEIVAKLKIKPEKIRVIPLGVDEKFSRRSSEEILRWKEKNGLRNKKIVGFLGSIFRRRNVPVLVEATSLLRKEFPETVLYLVGKNLSHPPQNIAKLLNKNWIRWEMSVSESELPLYYSALDVFAYLSEYEGFGLPPLEALACGTVPLLLNRSSLHEIYSEMAIMVESADVDEVREGLKRALTDEVKIEEVLNKFAQKRAQFSWRKAAKELAQLMKENA